MFNLSLRRQAYDRSCTINSMDRSTNYNVRSVGLRAKWVSRKAGYPTCISIEFADTVPLISGIKARGAGRECLRHLTTVNKEKDSGSAILGIGHHLSVFLHLLPQGVTEADGIFSEYRAGVVLIAVESDLLKIS